MSRWMAATDDNRKNALEWDSRAFFDTGQVFLSKDVPQLRQEI